MDSQVIATNLLRLRKAHRQTQQELADAAGLSRDAYRAIEKGRSLPRVENLRAIAAALGVPLQELVTPVQRLEHVRFRSLKRLKSRDQVLVEVGRWLRDFRELEDLLGQQQEDGLRALRDRVEALRPGGVVAIAEAARRHFGLTDREPVHDICGLLESRGVKVFTVHVTNDAFLGLSVGVEDGGPAVVVNTWDRLAVEHWIYSAAHELGHLLLHLDAYDVEVEEEDDQQEREAEVFASHFLMPDAVFWREWRDAAGLALLDRVVKVKRVFRVSWRAVLYRVSERLPKEDRRLLWQRMNVEYQRRYGRRLLKLTEPSGVGEDAFRARWPIARAGAEPARLDARDFQGDRLARLVREGVERDVITLSRAAEILGLSVDEMRDRAASWVA
ncbi:MAG: XRE family transcriptional regulator [Deltaproteobacteria bacterium]|nr:MAG: XRE family transcriptional regulator [Deltaproteobacteria bacterium]